MSDAENNEIKPWLEQQWLIPPKAGAAFVAPMEDVLENYAKRYDSTRPGASVNAGSCRWNRWRIPSRQIRQLAPAKGVVP